MKPLLITLTGPSCNGKSTILRHLTEHFGLETIVSTTTRGIRPGEVGGKDYYFITDEQSRQLESEDKFAELITFRGVRYGVTKEEMSKKLSGEKISTIILEPVGVGIYADLCRQLNVLHFKVFVDTPLDVRVQRLRDRMFDDISRRVITTLANASLDNIERAVEAAGRSHVDRLVATLTEEQTWARTHNWDLVVDGTEPVNLTCSQILNQAERYQATH